jgi:hypothetical protein
MGAEDWAILVVCGLACLWALIVFGWGLVEMARNMLDIIRHW